MHITNAKWQQTNLKTTLDPEFSLITKDPKKSSLIHGLLTLLTSFFSIKRRLSRDLEISSERIILLSNKKLDNVKKNIEVEQVYQSIEDQQKMIIDLVNNVISDRERELKKKNQMLRDRIEKLEQSISIEEARREQKRQLMLMNPELIQQLPKKVHYQDQGVYYDNKESDDSESSDDDNDEGSDNSSDSNSDSDSSDNPDPGIGYAPRNYTP